MSSPTSLRLAETALVGLLSALSAAVPSALHLAAGGFGLLTAWSAVAALLFVPVVAIIAFVRAGRPLLKDLTSCLSGARGVALLVWMTIAFPFERRFSALLIVHTHHRGLGGTAFAAGSIAVLFVAGLLAFRAGALVTRMARIPARARLLRRVNGVAWAVLLASIFWQAAHGLGAASPSGPVGAAAEIGWAFLALVAGGLVDVNILWKPAEIAGLAAAVAFVTGLGGTELARSSSLRVAVQAQAPLAGAVLGAGTAKPPGRSGARDGRPGRPTAPH